jgi:hypothetical protein
MMKPALLISFDGAFVCVCVCLKDFLAWNIRNDVSVCDLGADTSAVLFKGEEMSRKSMPCRRHYS